MTLAWIALSAFGAVNAAKVTHNMGTTKAPEAPKHLVLINEGTEAALVLGVTPASATQSWLGYPWYNHVTEAFANTENLGKENGISIELLAALEPDLIFANKQRHEEIYPQLSAIALTVVPERL